MSVIGARKASRRLLVLIWMVAALWGTSSPAAWGGDPFVSKDGLFSIRFPEGWTLSPQTNEQVFVFKEGSRTVMIMTLPGTRSLDSAFQTMLSVLKTSLSNAVSGDKPIDISVNDHPARFGNFAGKATGTTIELIGFCGAVVLEKGSVGMISFVPPISEERVRAEGRLLADIFGSIDSAAPSSGTRTPPQQGISLSADTPRIMRYKALQDAQDWKPALEVLREEIASPMQQTPQYLGNLNILGISTLGRYGEQFGPSSQLDDEARQYYEAALRHAGDDENRQADAKRAYALFFSNTGRNGQAAVFAREDLDQARKSGNTYRIIAGYDSLASLYHDMGQDELGRHYRSQALSIARDYFRIDQQPTSPDQWLGYSRILKKHIDDLAKPGNAAEVAETWQLYEAISARYLALQSLTYQDGAQMFALAGDNRRAQEMLRKAEEAWEREAGRMEAGLRQKLTLDLMAAKAAVAFRAGDNEGAISGLEQQREEMKRIGMNLDLVTQHRIRGQAYERLGKLEQAQEAYRASIQGTEKARDSFSIAQRAAFFRSVARQSYWGLIRVLARAHEKSRAEGEFIAALLASEQVRARQLGDMLDAKASLTPADVREFSAGLAPDEVVLAYTLMDEEIVLLAFSRNAQLSQVIPYAGNRFRKDVLALAQDLASPESELASVQARLGQIGQVLVGPAQGLLAGKRRMLVLSDGIIGTLPFDLLGIGQGGYRPLIADFTVRLAPSLRILLTASRRVPPSSGLMAIADPAFAKSPVIAGLTASELQGITRGNRLLSYFQPLPETRREVETISKLFTGQQARLLVGARARESEVKQADLRKYAYLHFATHGILGGDLPGIEEPALVLSEEPGQDGFLMASEAAELKLDARLTVLSACQTGSGEYYTGEGVMGMSRSFLAAGSRAVVVSLWSVESLATERLMVKFYTLMKNGLAAPDALRQAKLDMLGGWDAKDATGNPPGKPGYRHPFFWAAFIVFGS